MTPAHQRPTSGPHHGHLWLQTQAVTWAIARNSDLLTNAARDPDLGSLRDHGKLDALLGYG